MYYQLENGINASQTLLASNLKSTKTIAEGDLIKSTIGIISSFIHIYRVVYTYVYAVVSLSVFAKG